MKIIVLSPKITPRLTYIFKLIFKDILGTEPLFTTNKGDFLAYDGAKVSYGFRPMADEVFFSAHDLLFETGIDNPKIEVFEFGKQKVFFRCGEWSELLFDPFAASFYLVSRYEEYIHALKRNTNAFDIYGRFRPEMSVAHQNGFLQKAFVNFWADKIKLLVLEKYPQVLFPEKKYCFTPTIDVDVAYSYLGRDWKQQAGATVKSLLQLRFADFQQRIKTLLGTQADPYDVFDYLEKIQRQTGLSFIYFFLVGDRGTYDRNLPVTSTKYRSLIKKVSTYSATGLHSSYAANSAHSVLAEKERMKKITHKEMIQNRQHYIRFSLPDTYRILIEAGITDDYSMGYVSEPGFRAGICTPFYFYDLGKEEETKLRIHPFCWMDRTLMKHKKLRPNAAVECMKSFIEEVKSINGTLYSVWHNDLLGGEYELNGWRDAFEEIMQTGAPF